MIRGATGELIAEPHCCSTHRGGHGELACIGGIGYSHGNQHP